MNKYTLYQTAYGEDPFWREGWYNPLTEKYLTLSEYEARKNHEDMNGFQLVYPESDVQKSWEKRSQLPGFQEIIRGSAADAKAALLGRGCEYETFREKLGLEEEVFNELCRRYNLTESTYLAELFVRPDQQGQGLGHSLLQEYIDFSKQEGRNGVLTRTTSLKSNPQRMFLKAGFETVLEYGPADPRKRKLFYLLLQ